MYNIYTSYIFINLYNCILKFNMLKYLLLEVDIVKITLLGTGAVGYPLAFCNCQNCKNAREHKGKSIRKCSSILINDDLIIDLGPDTQTAMNMYDKDMGKIKYLLQTHSHTDHYDENILCSRLEYKTKKNINKIEIFAKSSCIQIMRDRINQIENIDIFTDDGEKKINIQCNAVNSGEKFKFGDYKVKAIHTLHDEDALLYVVSWGDTSIFYATDTSSLTDEALNQLRGIKLDFIFMDHTFGNVDYSFSHLNEKLFLEQLDKLKNIGCIDENTQIYGTHISHEGHSYHEEIEENAMKNGYHIAYDGMTLEK